MDCAVVCECELNPQHKSEVCDYKQDDDTRTLSGVRECASSYHICAKCWECIMIQVENHRNQALASSIRCHRCHSQRDDESFAREHCDVGSSPFERARGDGARAPIAAAQPLARDRRCGGSCQEHCQHHHALQMPAAAVLCETQASKKTSVSYVRPRDR